MALPVSGTEVGNALYDIVLKGYADFDYAVYSIHTGT